MAKKITTLTPDQKAKAPALTYDEILDLDPCGDEFQDSVELLGGKEKWNKTPVNAAMAADAGILFDNIIWVFTNLAEKDTDVWRRLRLWAADCAAHVLHIYEENGDSNAPRNAVIAARQFARGEVDKDNLAAAVDAVRRVLKNFNAVVLADDRVFRAASWAAEAAMCSAVWDYWAPAQVSCDALSAVQYASGVAARRAARKIEEQWQSDRLVMWMSDDEPEDWPLPERKA